MLGRIPDHHRASLTAARDTRRTGRSSGCPSGCNLLSLQGPSRYPFTPYTSPLKCTFIEAFRATVDGVPVHERFVGLSAQNLLQRKSMLQCYSLLALVHILANWLLDIK